MNQQKLFHKNFIILILGQIISLFGNVILRFALSMFVLDQTGSVAIFGTILAISMIPTILFSSFGGILADRVNKRNIMIALDFTTSGIILLFTLLLHASNIVVMIGIMMILLSLIQAFYQPSVQSSIPVLVEEEHLASANGIVIQVNALANLLGPIIGGFLYGFLGIFPILIISGSCFFISAVMEYFLHIPFYKQETTGGIFSTIKGDFKETFQFLVKEQMPIFKMLLVIAGLNLFLSAMIIIGLPYMIKILLGLSNQWYGFAEAAMGIGSIIGGITAGLFIKKIGFHKSYLLLLIASITILPLGFCIISTGAPIVSYALILVSILITMCLTTVFSVYGQTVMQKLTPTHLLGKVSSFVTVICMCALPIGQAMYGGLFNVATSKSYIVVFLTTIICVGLAFIAKHVLNKIPEV